MNSNYFQKYNNNNNVLSNLINLKEYNCNDYKLINIKFKQKLNKKEDIKNKSSNFISTDFSKKLFITKNKKNFNLLIKKYYEKVISEEELFYLYFDIYTIKLNEKKIYKK